MGIKRDLEGGAMKIDTMGYDIKISEFVNGLNSPTLEFSNEDEKTVLEFDMDRQGFEYTVEQFISALANYDEDLLIKTLSDYASLEVK